MEDLLSYSSAKASDTSLPLLVKQRRKRLRALQRLSDEDPQKLDALRQFQIARSKARKIVKEAKQNAGKISSKALILIVQPAKCGVRLADSKAKKSTSIITLNLPTGLTNNGRDVLEALADE